MQIARWPLVQGSLLLLVDITGRYICLILLSLENVIDDSCMKAADRSCACERYGSRRLCRLRCSKRQLKRAFSFSWGCTAQIAICWVKYEKFGHQVDVQELLLWCKRYMDEQPTTVKRSFRKSCATVSVRYQPRLIPKCSSHLMFFW